MTAKECRTEMRECILFYEELGWCWISPVTYIGIKFLFGSWDEIGKYFRPIRKAGRPRK